MQKPVDPWHRSKSPSMKIARARFVFLLLVLAIPARSALAASWHYFRVGNKNDIQTQPAVFLELAAKGALRGEDARQPDKVRQGIARCEASMTSLPGPHGYIQ